MMNLWKCAIGLALAAPIGLAQANPVNRVAVTVAGSSISANPEPVRMTKSQNKIRWELQATGYQFTADGIVIHDAVGDYGDCAPKGPKSEAFECKKLKHAAGKQFKYDINLLAPDGQKISQDPIIQND